MNRLDRPFSNLRVDSDIRRIPQIAKEIAEDHMLQRRLHDFFTTAVDPAEFMADGHTYNYHQIALIGKSTLISVYSQLGATTLPTHEAQVAITSSLRDIDDVPEPWYTLSIEKPYLDQSTELVLGVPEGMDEFETDYPGLSESERQRHINRLYMDAEREWQSLPRIHWGGNELWRMERDGECELLTDLRTVHEMVRLAISMGIGSAAEEFDDRFTPDPRLALKSEEPETEHVTHLEVVSQEEQTGQKEEMMVA